MAGTKRGPRKKTPTKGKDASPRGKATNRSKEDKTPDRKKFLGKDNSSLRAVTRNAKKTSTQVVVALRRQSHPNNLITPSNPSIMTKTKKRRMAITTLKTPKPKPPPKTLLHHQKLSLPAPTIRMNKRIHPLHPFTRSTYTCLKHRSLQTTTNTFIPATKILPVMRTNKENPSQAKPHERATRVARTTQARSPTNNILTPISLQANTPSIHPYKLIHMHKNLRPRQRK
jgi:hypothetical protein